MYPYKREAEGDLTHRREGNVTTEAELKVMQPQAKECQWPPKVEETKNKFFPRAYGGKVALLTPWF